MIYMIDVRYSHLYRLDVTPAIYMHNIRKDTNNTCKTKFGHHIIKYKIELPKFRIHRTYNKVSNLHRNTAKLSYHIVNNDHKNKQKSPHIIQINLHSYITYILKYLYTPASYVVRYK